MEGGRDQADGVGCFIGSEEKRSLNVHFRLNVIESKYPIYYYASVGGATEAYGSRVRVCCVCNSVPPISRRALKSKDHVERTDHRRQS